MHADRADELYAFTAWWNCYRFYGLTAISKGHDGGCFNCMGLRFVE